MLLLPALTLGVILGVGDWHLPALRPGRSETLQVGSETRYFDFRYHALWDLELELAATTQEDVGLLLEVYDERGTLVAADRDHEGETDVGARVLVARGARLRVRVGAASPEEAGALELEARETPDEATAAARSLPADASSADFQGRQFRARTAADAERTRAIAAMDAGKEVEAHAGVERAIALLAPVVPILDPQLVALRIILIDWRFHDDLAALTPEELGGTIGLAERCEAITETMRLRLRISLGNLLGLRGDIDSARALLEVVVPAADRLFQPEDEAPIIARLELAFVLFQQGAVARARALAERELARVQREWPVDSGVAFQARGTLVSILHACGDAAAACALQEENVAGIARVRPPDHLDLVSQRLLLARLETALGRHADAAAVRAAAVATLEARSPEASDLLAIARMDLAASERELGRLPAARARLEQMLAAAAARGIRGPDVQSARAALALVLGDLGEWREKREIEEALMRELEGAELRGDTRLIDLRGRLALTLAVLGEPTAMAGELERLARELDTALAERPPFSFRELGAAVEQHEPALATLLSLAPSAGPGPLAAWTFERIETLRALTTARGFGPAGPEDPELHGARARVDAARRAMDLLVAQLRETAAPDARARSLVADSVRACDDAEHELLALLERRGRRTSTIRLAEVVRSLHENAAAVGFRRYRRTIVGTGPPASVASADHLLAHVVRHDGRLLRIELGPIAPIEAAIASWRGSGSFAAGRALHELLLAPVAAAAPDATTLHACLDDVLFLVPLDAVPQADGTLVGERLQIELLPSFAALVAPLPPCTTPPSLVVCGAIDYGATSGGAEPFGPLLATRFEIETVARLFRETFDLPATSVSGTQATSSALRRLAGTSRQIHVATHGWIVGPADRALTAGEPEPFVARLRALAPMTLCGLALAGANQGGAEGGGPDGRLTAEELAGFDLAGCDLVVLSACDTSVGVGLRRAGQGLQSLQSALHAAGARSAVTSLWRVNDLATRDFMEEFYEALWREGRSKRAALWQAKMALRAAGEPLRNWAGWVLSGTGD